MPKPPQEATKNDKSQKSVHKKTKIIPKESIKKIKL
jgi:hypothetical protein